jgi:hypothetical protein
MVKRPSARSLLDLPAGIAESGPSAGPWCAPHGFIKKTQKTPPREIHLALIGKKGEG